MVKFYTLVVLLFACQLSPSFCQPSQNNLAIPLKQYKINHWTTDDGLASNTLLNLYQDEIGYLWIASYDGLTRFDGSEFVIYTKRSGLPSSQIQGLIGDSKSNLWLGTGEGLVKYDGVTFIKLAGDHSLFIQTLLIDEPNHKILIGTRGEGLYTFDYATNKYEKFESPYLKDIIRVVLKDRKGNIWVGSEKVGLSYYSSGKWKTFTEKDGLTNHEINSLYLDQDDQLYVGTNGGMFIHHEGTFTRDPTVGGETVNSIDQDSTRNLWVLTNSGIFRKNNYDGSWEILDKQDGLSNNDIQDVLFDSEGSIWVTTYRGGLHQLRESKFKTYSTANGLDSDETSAVEEIGEDKFIIGSIDGTLSIIDHGIAKPLHLKTPIDGRIYDFLLDNKNIWIATRHALILLKPDGSEKIFTAKEGLPPGQIWVVTKDKRNNYWIGSRTGGMLKMEFKSYPDKPVFTEYKKHEINSAFIMSIKEDDKTNLYISTNTGGLNIITNSGDVKQFDKGEGLNSNVVFNSYTDASGATWMATTEGLSCYTDSTFFNYTYEDGLPFESILDVLEDGQGQLWMPTGIGIVRVNKQELIDYKNGKIKRIYWKVFNKNDGMKVPQCTGASHALKATDGRLWFPTFGGIVSVDPTSITTNKVKPKVNVEKMVVDDRSVNLSNEINLPPGNHRIVFHYTALSLLNPNSAKYKYRLKNFDADWIEAGNGRQAVYTSLKNGSYTFQVIACNNDDIWNTVGTSIDFVVQPHYYQTQWFSALLAIVFVFIVFAYSKLRTNAINRRSMALEKEVQNRTEQLLDKTKEIEQKNENLKEQNEEITSMVNIVAHDLRAPLNKITGLTHLLSKQGELNSEQQEYLHYIEMVIQHGNDLVRDLLDVHSFEDENSKPNYSEIDLRKFMDDWQQSVEEELKQKNQHMHVVINANKPVYSDPTFLTRILDNLSTNASKFSESGKNVFVTLSDRNQLLDISVRDEGPGISEEDQKKMFKRFQKLTARPTAGESSNGLGLAIIKKLTEKLGGQVIVRSKLGQGTEFIISLPVNGQHSTE